VPRFGRRSVVIFLLALLPLEGVEAGAFPWKTSLRRDLPVATATVGLAAAGHLLAEQIPPVQHTLSSRTHIFPLDRSVILPYSEGWGHLSDAGLVVSALLPFAGYLSAAGSDQEDVFPRLGVLELETLSLVTGLTYLTKVATQRPRPYAYRKDTPTSLLRSPDSRASFFSGHAAIAFASAELGRQFVEAANGPVWLAWGGYGVGAVTAAGRVLAGVHFPTDVVVGAAVGVVCAKAVLALHRQDESDRVETVFAPGVLSFRVSF